MTAIAPARKPDTHLSVPPLFAPLFLSVFWRVGCEITISKLQIVMGRMDGWVGGRWSLAGHTNLETGVGTQNELNICTRFGISNFFLCVFVGYVP